MAQRVSIANRNGLVQKTKAVEYSKPKWKSIVTKSDKAMTPNPAKEEIAVNPRRQNVRLVVTNINQF